MSFYPTPWSVGVRTFVAGGLDSHGDPVDSWGSPVAHLVYGWAPAGTTEPGEVNRDEVTWDLDLYAPPEFTVGARDRVVVDGVEYVVEGRLEDFNHGPFGFGPGGRVRLTRVEG